MASRASLRVRDEPAFVLHQHDWSESSLILDVFSRHHGRVALVGKGVKRPSSQFRAVLLPLLPLRLDWSGQGEVRTLKAAHYGGGWTLPAGEALLAGYYLNELLLRLLLRDDPHPALFDDYTAAVRALSDASALPAALRAFELLLLRHLGWLPNLALDGVRQCPVDPAKPYALQAQWGLVPVASGDPAAWPGACWLRLQQALEAPAPWVALMAQPADLAHSALRLGLAALLHYHSGVRAFRVRELLRALKRLQPRAAASATEVMP